ncbi:MAG: hypothetical protein R2716_01790 [Microthrixaceae bacterium]
MLGKVKQLERTVDQDVILLDAPAAGHAISFLRSARGLADAVRSGPINAQATEVLDLLSDPRRCRVVLVTLPEETPVNELVETAFSLEEDVGVALGPVVVNGVYPRLEGLGTPAADAARDAGVHLVEGEAEVLDAAAEFRAAGGPSRTHSSPGWPRCYATADPPPHLFTTGVVRGHRGPGGTALVEGIESLEAGAGA